MYIKLYTFSKKKNSTAVPAASNLVADLSGTIVNDANTSMLNPMLRITIPNDTYLHANYVGLPAFGRYYFINDWLYNADGTWTISCSVDPLGSWKSAILSSGGYLGRSSDTTLQNKNIIDRYYPASTDFVTIVDEMSTGLYINPSTTFYVIGVISADSPTLGAVKYFITSLSQLQTLISNLVNTSAETWTSTQGLTDDALKSLVNPIQYIVSCKWFPFGVAAISDQSPIIRVYSWDTGARGLALTQTYSRYPDTGWKELTITDITDHWTPDYGSVDLHYYPYDSPYAQYSLITPWGVFEIDPDVVSDYFKNQIDVGEHPKLQWALTNVNLVSGTAIFEVRMRNNARASLGGDPYYTLLLRREVNIALDIPLAQATVDYVNMARSSLAAANQATDVLAWMTNPVGNAANIASNIVDAAVAAISPTVQSTASGEATFTPVIEKMYFQQKRFKTIGQSNNLYGRPCKKEIASIGSVASGTYIQMDYSTFKGVCTIEENQMIVEALESGCYIE